MLGSRITLKRTLLEVVNVVMVNEAYCWNILRV